VPSGFLIVSGFLKEDKELLLQAAEYTKLKLCNVLNKEGWLSILFYKMA
jgi:ribosomal protein L11 methylase PrmA